MFRMTRYFLPAAILILICASYSRAQQNAATGESGKDAVAVQKKVENKIDRVQKKLEDKLIRLKDQLKEKENRKQMLKEEQISYRQKIYQEGSLMSPENVVPCLLSMEREILTLRTDLAVKEVTQKELAQRIAETSEDIEKLIKDDQVLKKMKDIVDNRKDNLESLRHRRNIDSVGEKVYSQAQMEISEAEIRLALRREELLKGNATEAVQKLNLILRENSLAIVQIRTRLDVLLSKYEELIGVRNLVDEYMDITEIEFPRLNRTIDRITEQLEQLEFGYIPESQ